MSDMLEELKALAYIEGLLAKADPELFECACKGGHASELLPVDIGEMFGVSNALRAALAHWEAERGDGWDDKRRIAAAEVALVSEHIHDFARGYFTVLTRETAGELGKRLRNALRLLSNIPAPPTEPASPAPDGPADEVEAKYNCQDCELEAYALEAENYAQVTLQAAEMIALLERLGTAERLLDAARVREGNLRGALKKIAADDGLYTHRHEYEAIARTALKEAGE